MILEEYINKQYKNWSSNGLGNDFDGYRTTGIYAFSTISAILRHYNLENLKNSRVLDFGSGTGRLANLIIPYTKEYICADISDLFLNDCKENLKSYKNCLFHKIEDSPNLNFDDDFFDFSFSYLSLFAENKINLQNTLKEIDRVSKNFCLQIGDIKDYDLGILGKKDRQFRFGIGLSIPELKKLFRKDNYIFEILSP